MERKLKKLTRAEAEALKQYETKPLDAEQLDKVAGGYPGPEMNCCPACGGDLIRETYLIKGGPEAGKTEIGVYCPFCGYEEYWIL